MNSIIFILGWSLISFIQVLPLRVAAELGRIGGLLFYLIDGRHRRVAMKNVGLCFPEKSSDEVRDLVKENFKRVGESYTSAIKTASMSEEEVRKRLECVEPPGLLTPQEDEESKNILFAVGHFGNFELYTQFGIFWPAYRSVSTFRGLNQPSLNSLLKKLRANSTCEFFDRRSESGKMRAAMSGSGVILGLLSDQDGGDRGLQLPLFGHNCSTSPAPAIYALRYDCVLCPLFCYRIAPGRWRMEAGERIPTHEEGKPRTTEAIMREVNAAMEEAIRKDPANWFWVHNRWKRGRANPDSE